MAYTAGTAWLQVSPSFLHLDQALRRDVRRMAARIDAGLREVVPDSLRESIRDGINDGVHDGFRDARRDMHTEGERAGQDFSRGFDRGLNRGGRLDDSIRQRVQEVGTRRTGGPDDPNRRLSERARQLESSTRQGPSPDFQRTLDRLAFDRSTQRISSTAPRFGDTTALADRAVHAPVVDDTDLNRALDRVGERLTVAGDRTRHFGDSVSLGDEEFHRSMARVSQDTRDFGQTMRLTDRGFHEAITRISGLPQADPSRGEPLRGRETVAPIVARIDADTTQAREAGARAGGAFSAEVRRTLETSLRSLPDVEIDGDTSQVDADVQHVREELATLLDQHINLDVDDEAALLEIRRLQARLRELSAQTTSVTVRFDVDRAQETLNRFAEQVAPTLGRRSGDRFGGGFDEQFRQHVLGAVRALPDIDINANPTGAQRAIAEIRAELATLSTQRVGVDIDSGEAMTRLGILRARLEVLSRTRVDIQVTADTAAAAAQLALVAAEAEAVDNAVGGMNSTANASVGRLGAIIAAALSFGTVLVPAAAAAAVAIGGIATAAGAAVAGFGVLALGLSGIIGAVGALNKYQQDAGKSAKSLAAGQKQVATSADAITSAERSLANTREQVAIATKRDARNIVDAQRSVIDAERDALRAQLDLTKAVKAAQQQDEDRAFQLRDNALAQRQAALDMAQAKADLDRIVANPRASAAEREQALITFEQRKLQIEQLSTAGQRLADEKADADKKGVQGSDQVVAAQERIRTTTQAVADAQRKVADAIEAAAQQQRQGQFQIESAQQAVTSAQRAQTQAFIAAGVAGGSALDTLRAKMSALSPAGQKFARMIFGLKDEFLGLRAAAETSMLPKLQTAIERLIPFFPALTTFISKMGSAVGDAFLAIVNDLRNPEWAKFFHFMSDSFGPALVGMAEFTITVARGLGSLIQALSPFNRQMGAGLLDLAEGFAKWAAALSTSSGFVKFFAYVKETGPEVVDLIGKMGTFIARFVIAAAFTGELMLNLFRGLFAVLNALPLPILSALIIGISTLTGLLLLNAAAVGLSARRIALWSSLQLVWARAVAAGTVLMNFYTGSVTAAALSQGIFARSYVAVAIGATRAAGAVRAAGAAITAAGLSLGAIATVAVVAGAGLYYIKNAHDANIKSARESAKGLGELAREYDRTGRVSDAFLRTLEDSNPAARRQVQMFKDMGVSVDDLGKALAGNAGHIEQVNAAIDARIKQLQQEMHNNFWDIFANEKRDNEITALTELKAKLDAIAEANAKVGVSNGLASDTAAQYAEKLLSAQIAARKFSSEQGDLLNAFRVIGDATASATDRTNAFTHAYDLLFGATTRQADANLNFQKSLLGLTDAVDQNGTAIDTNSTSGIANTEMLKGIIQDSVDLAGAELGAGATIEQVNAAHATRIKRLEDEAVKSGLSKTAVDGLVKTYGTIPTQITTDFATDPNSLKNVKDAFRDILTDVEYLIKYGYLPVRTPTGYDPHFIDKTVTGRTKAQAEGGYIRGPGTTTSDDIAAWLSDREFVEPAHAVDFYGVPVFEALRRHKLPKELFHGVAFAGGGLVRPFRQQPGILPIKEPDIQNAAVMIGQMRFAFTEIATDAIKKLVIDAIQAKQQAAEMAAGTGSLGPIGPGPGFSPWPAGPGAQRGDSGVWRSVVNLIRSTGPISGTFGNAYRPGDPLWHGSGRAVDWMGFNQDALATFLAVHRPLELIHRSNTRDYAYTRGVNKGSFHEGLMQEHRNHVHIAMDDGGMLRPGWNPPMWNGTGRPEPVLNPGQWDTIRKAVVVNAQPQVIHHWEFRDTTLDAGKLAAINAAEAAYARAGRAR